MSTNAGRKDTRQITQPASELCVESLLLWVLAEVGRPKTSARAEGSQQVILGAEAIFERLVVDETHACDVDARTHCFNPLKMAMLRRACATGIQLDKPRTISFLLPLQTLMCELAGQHPRLCNARRRLAKLLQACEHLCGRGAFGWLVVQSSSSCVSEEGTSAGTSGCCFIMYTFLKICC